MLKKFIIFALVATYSQVSSAGLLKWVKKEAMPTLTGQRPVSIKPYVSIQSGATKIKLGSNSAMIKVGGVTVQTGKLKLRLAQAGCVLATGDVMTCAPDVIEREAGKIFADVFDGIQIPDASSGTASSGTAGGVAPSSSGGIKFVDAEMKEIPWEPPSVSVGYDFSNPGGPPSAPSASAFLHTIAIARTKDQSGKAVIGIVGRADFGFMQGRTGGVLCLFASEKGKYLRDRNGTFTDQYGLAAIGGSTKVTQVVESMVIRLGLPWAEMELPPDDDPYATKYAQCHITVDDEVMQSTEWIQF